MMDDYSVHLKILMDMAVKEDNPDAAYVKASQFVTNHLNSIFDNMQFLIIDGFVTDESGSRVD